MAHDLKPDPSDFLRESDATRVRNAATWARKVPPMDIDPPDQKSNDEIKKFHPEVPTTFTKGLHHDQFGIVDPDIFARFVKFINQPRSQPNLFKYSDPDGDKKLPDPVKVGPKGGTFNDKTTGLKARTWESPLAGHVFSLEGADADMVAMPPAPKLGSGELSVEMAEVYALALLRDVPFTDITAGNGKAKDVIKGLKGFSWFTAALSDPKAEARRKARLDDKGDLTKRVVFRGSTKGAKKGPYLSQFMLIGNASRGDSEPVYSTGEAVHAQNICPIRGRNGKPAKASDGYIVYGTQLIDQRTSAHRATDSKGNPVDYMTDWASWIDAQNGANFKNRDSFEKDKRFITTPRDLGSYVHFDQLYQAYLNACLIMLAYNYPFDEGVPEGNGHRVRDAFATFGGPHILSLVTEVATRALKFARRQKFNIHLRARPEAIAGVLTLAKHANHADAMGAKAKRAAKEALKEFDNAAAASGVDLLGLVAAHNRMVNDGKSITATQRGWIKQDKNNLLPMAFPEGSPMHPSYAAGHATVAGACITILKAFFMMFDAIDTGTPTKNKTRPDPKKNAHWKERAFTSIYGDDIAAATGLANVTTGIFAPSTDGTKLEQQDGPDNEGLTVLGELDKLAANISIGRDMAGVHYYTDYYESLRMGERLAVSILEEQMLTYPEPVTMRLKTFDGDRMVIEGQGDGASVEFRIARPKGSGWRKVSYKDWFER